MSKGKEHELTKAALHRVVEEMYDRIASGLAPTMTLPVRTKTNIEFDERSGVYKYGSSLSTRDATNLKSAKNLLRALHIVEFIEEMIDGGKSSTLREMYYISEAWGHGKFSSRTINNLAEISRSSPDRCVRISSSDQRRTGRGLGISHCEN